MCIVRLCWKELLTVWRVGLLGPFSYVGRLCLFGLLCKAFKSIGLACLFYLLKLLRTLILCFVSFFGEGRWKGVGGQGCLGGCLSFVLWGWLDIRDTPSWNVVASWSYCGLFWFVIGPCGLFRWRHIVCRVGVFGWSDFLSLPLGVGELSFEFGIVWGPWFSFLLAMSSLFGLVWPLVS